MSRVVEFQGKKYDFPEDATDSEVTTALNEDQPRTLFSTAGIRSAAEGVIPSLVQGYLGHQLQAHENVKAAWEKRNEVPVTGDITEERYKESLQRIPEIQTTLRDVSSDLDASGDSRPLRWFKSAINSVVQNAPGMAAAVATRDMGMVAALPSLSAAREMQIGQTYAEGRTPDEQGKPKGTIQETNLNADVQGVTEAGFELIPMKFLVTHLGKDQLGKFLLGYFGRELGTELPTTAAQNLSDWATVSQDMSFGDFAKKMGNDLIDTAMSTVMATGMSGPSAHVMTRVGQINSNKLDIPKIDALDLTKKGEDNSDLTPPLIPPAPVADHPTVVPPADQQAQIAALIASIDPDQLDDKAVADAKAVVAKHEEAKNAPTMPKAENSWSGLALAPRGDADIGETQLGTTEKQASNAANYSNPNQGDRLDRTFLYGPEGASGLTPRQVVLQPATYTLGLPSEDRDASYLKAIHDTVEQWRQKYMPGSTFVISNEGLFSNAALGWHYSIGPQQHLIVPAVIRSPSKGLGSFNVNTQASAFYNLTHEFGHGLVLDRFFEGVSAALQIQVQQESKTGVVSEKSLGLMPAAQQAVIREFNLLKQAILENKLSAQQFVEKWFSPGKLGQRNLLKELGVAPDDNAMTVVKSIVRRATSKSTIRDQIKQRDLQAMLSADYLSLDEYLAEQTARHAYTSNWDKQSPLGQFFSAALKSLRNFFAGLKKDGSLAPGTAFQEWIEGLGQSDRAVTQGDRVVLAKKKGAVPKKAPVAPTAAPQEKPKVSKPKKKVVRVEHNVATDTDEGKAKLGRKLVANLIATRALEANSAEVKELFGLLRTKDWDEFRDLFQRYAGKSVKFELNDINEDERQTFADMSVLRAGVDESVAMDAEKRAEAAQEWKEKQFRSRFFKAWFGDWENDGANSSKIRRGALIMTPAPMKLGTRLDGLIDSNFGREPLVVYHATMQEEPNRRELSKPFELRNTEAFRRFAKGDIGFHFGTVMAAHNRVGAATPEQIVANEGRAFPMEQTYIIPAVLNMRNPLYVGDESGANWGDIRMANWLQMRGFLSTEDVMAVMNSYEIMTRTAKNYIAQYESNAPLREMLISKGFDGIIYDNVVEGGISYIVFHPNQVKSLLGSRTFSRSDNLHMELDLDASRPENLGVRRLWDGLKNFTTDFPRMRRTLRKMSNAVYHVTELQQLAHLNPDLEELQFMNAKNGEYNRYKSRLQAQADGVLGEWSALGKENFAKLQKFLFAEVESKTLWWDLAKTQVTREGQPVTWYEYTPNATTATKAQEFGLDEELTVLAMKAKNVLLAQLNESEFALRALLLKRYGADPAVYAASTIPIARQIHELRKYPFFPQGRFGNRMLIIEKDKASGPGREIVWREHFEDAAKWEEAWKKAVANAAPDEHVRKEEVSDQHYVLMALPTDFVDMAASELGLSDEQLELLMNILQPVKRDKVLGAYDQQRLGIKGYSTDAMRSFANFTWHNSNLLAKLIYRADFNMAIRGIGVKLREQKYSQAPESLAQVERLQRIKTYMENTRDYIMAPPNEAQMLRAAVSIAYLGLNIKTAVLNTYGLITTWSDLTTRMGQIEGNKLFFKASLSTFKSLKLTNLNERRKGQYLSPEQQQALDQAIEEGVLSQSYAYHLAGMANAGNLYRLPARQTLARGGQLAIDAAMYVFRLTELSTRRASFLAEFEAAGKEPNLKSLGMPLSFEERYRLAVTRTNKLQNDYSLGNRVPFMRGFKMDNTNPLGKLVEPVIPLATVFMSFMQHMAFHTYGGYELGERRMSKELGETPRTIWGGYTMKIWIITLLLAGYEGLPGMENILDLLEAAWRKWGGPKPIRQELRELVQELEVDPQLASRGFGHNVAGFDVSRSVGFGRMVPGTDTLAHPRKSMAEELGILVLDLAGPTGGFIKFGLEAIGSNKSKAETFEKLPGGAGNIYTAYRWTQNGVRAPTGAQITFDLKTGQLRDLTADEIAGKFMGFNPTIVSQNREIRFNQYDRKVYWETRRQDLVQDLWTAILQKDREAEADAKKAILEYNAGVPAEYKAMRLTGADIMRSLQSREKIKRADENQTTTSRRYRPLYEDVRQSYDQP